MKSLIERERLHASDLYIGLPVVYSEEYVEAWDTAYYEGREDYAELQNIVNWKGVLVGLTTSGGIVTVSTSYDSAFEVHSYKTLHIDNLAFPEYLEDEDA